MYSREKIMKVGHEIKDDSNLIKPYVIIVQPRRDLKEVPAQNLDGHLGLNINVLGTSHAFANIGGEVVDVARNYLFEAAIESDAKYCLSVGEDTILPYDGYLKLHEVAEKNPNCAVVGVYYIKFSPLPMIMVRQNDWIVPGDPTPGQVYPVWVCGMDAMLIPVKILKEMKAADPEIPFCCIINNMEGLEFIGEDNFFWHRFHKMGYKILVNTDVQCLHCDLANHKYTCYPGLTEDFIKENYFTNFQLEGKLESKDREFVDKRWHSRLPKQYSGEIVSNGLWKPIVNLPIDYSKETEGRVRKKLEELPCLQNYYEVMMLCEHLNILKPSTILEVGVEHGGTLNLWAEFTTDDALCIGIDEKPESKDIKLANKEQKFEIVCGNSNVLETKDQVLKILGDRKLDFLFIDADHSYEGIKSDFELYSPLVRSGGVIAFHDIRVNHNQKVCFGSMQFWQELKEQYPDAVEFINTEADIHYGIGMIKIV